MVADERGIHPSYRKGNADVYVKNANRAGADVPLLESSSTTGSVVIDGRVAHLFGQGNFRHLRCRQFGEKKPPSWQGRATEERACEGLSRRFGAATTLDESGTFSGM